MHDLDIRRSKAKWTSAALGDVVDIINQYWDRDTAVPERLVAGEHIDEGDLRVRRWAMTDDELIPPTFNRWFQSGDVLLHSRNIKKVAQPEFGGITGEKLFILRSKDESVLLQSLVPYIVQSEVFHSYAESRWAGSTNKFLNKTPLQEFEFALPPIEEQRRLVKALKGADEVDEAVRKLVSSLEVLLRRVRADALSDGKAFRLHMVCALRGGSGFKPSAQGQSEGELPFIKVSDMDREGNEKSILSAANYVSRATARELRAKVFPPGATVFAKVGEALRQNRRRILVRETCIDNNMMAAIPDESLILPEFLLLVLMEIDFGDLVQEGTVPSVNQEAIGSCEVLVPDRSYQRVIISRVGSVEASLSKAKARRLEFRRFRDEIVRRGFEDV